MSLQGFEPWFTGIIQPLATKRARERMSPFFGQAFCSAKKLAEAGRTIQAILQAQLSAGQDSGYRLTYLNLIEKKMHVYA